MTRNFTVACRALCVLTVVAAFGVQNANAASTFDSYTDAYSQAGEDHKPMLVVLNGPAAEVDVDTLSTDTALASAMGDYVVAEIDTETAHGQKVLELFKSPALPHVVVIDDDKKKQLFKTSRSMSAVELASVLTEYKDGPPAAPQTVTANRPVDTVTSLDVGSTPVVNSTPVSQPVYSAPLASAPISSASAASAPMTTVPNFSTGLPQAIPANCPSCKLKAMGLIP